MKRLPLYLESRPTQLRDLLYLDFQFDVKPGDQLVFGDGSRATVNGVTQTDAGTRIKLGEDPTCGPRPHSGKEAPLWEDDGVTPWRPK